LPKSEIELIIELSLEEFKPYILKGAEKVSESINIKGFRPGKIPYDVLKQKVSEMTILEEAARIAINKTLTEVLKTHVTGQPVGQPRVDITKLAPNNPLEFKVVLAILPKVELGDYKNAKVKKEKVEIKDDEVNKTLNQLQEMRVKEIISDKPAGEGDKIIADIQMFLDNVPIEGGQSKETTVIIGKDYLVPGFDKKLIGAKKSEVREFSLPYPKEHYQKNIAGKLVEFKIKIKEIYNRQLPKLDDELAKNLGAKNLEEIKKSLKKNIELEKAQAAEQKTELEIINKIVAKSKFADIPETLINHEVETMLNEFEHNISSQGGKFTDYLSSLNKTREQFSLDLVPEAIKRTKNALIIREIALKENITVDEKEIAAKQKELINQYKGYEKVEERINDPSYKIYLSNILANQKVMTKLKEWNLE
ncbi:MAG: trigger factor, partial [Patescibacteria group bacterium]